MTHSLTLKKKEMVHSTQELVIFCAFFGKPLKDLKQRIDLITKKCFRYLSCTYFYCALGKEGKVGDKCYW